MSTVLTYFVIHDKIQLDTRFFPVMSDEDEGVMLNDVAVHVDSKWASSSVTQVRADSAHLTRAISGALFTKARAMAITECVPRHF